MKKINPNTDWCMNHKPVNPTLDLGTCVGCKYNLYANCWFEDKNKLIVKAAIEWDNGKCKELIHSIINSRENHERGEGNGMHIGGIHASCMNQLRRDLMIDFVLANGKEQNITIGGKYLGEGKAVVYPNNIYALQRFTKELMNLDWILEDRTILSMCRSIEHEVLHCLLDTYNEEIIIALLRDLQSGGL